MRRLIALQEHAHTMAKDKGWWDPEKSWDEQIALYHSEVSEAFEHWRNGRAPDEVFYATTSPSGLCSPDGIPIEFADLAIRVLDSCGRYKVEALDVWTKLLASHDVVTTVRFSEHIAHLHRRITYATDQGPNVHTFAQILGHTFALCRFHHIDLFAAIDIKMTYNEQRTHRHGGKRA